MIANISRNPTGRFHILGRKLLESNISDTFCVVTQAFNKIHELRVITGHRQTGHSHRVCNDSDLTQARRRPCVQTKPDAGSEARTFTRVRVQTRACTRRPAYTNARMNTYTYS